MAIRPGKRALVKVSGAPVVFVTEACSVVTANIKYQITNPIKQTWDRAIAVLVYKAAVLQATNLYTINRLTGTITFLVDQGVSVITVSGSYLPMAAAIEGRSYHWEITRVNLDVSPFGAVWRTRIENLHDGKCSVGQWKTVDETMINILLAGAGVPVVLEFWSDTTLPAQDIRMWGLPQKDSINAVLTNAVEQSIDFEATLDVDGNILG